MVGIALKIMGASRKIIRMDEITDGLAQRFRHPITCTVLPSRVQINQTALGIEHKYNFVQLPDHFLKAHLGRPYLFLRAGTVWMKRIRVGWAFFHIDSAVLGFIGS
jgi:hypothetical protein